MIAIGTKNLNKLVYSGLFDLKKFILEHEEVGCIETSLEYDNDILLRGRIPKGTEVLSKIPCLRDLDVTVEFNRLSLGVDYNQLCILLDAKKDWEDTENINEILKISDKYRIGLYGVTEVEEIMYIQEHIKLDYIEVNLNPLLYPKSVLDYAKENGITVISHDIFGGEYWAGYLGSMFPKKFLYDFAWYNSGIQVIPGDDLYFLSEIVSRGIKEEEESKLCTYSKDVNKLPALIIPPKKIHGQTKINIPGVLEVTMEGSDVYSLGEVKEEIKTENILWEDKDLPGDIDTKNKELLGCLHRYHVPVFLDEKYNPKWWKKIYTKVAPDFWVIKLIPRKWYLGWIAKEYIFWMISGKLIKIPLSAHQNLINDNINI